MVRLKKIINFISVILLTVIVLLFLGCASKELNITPDEEQLLSKLKNGGTKEAKVLARRPKGQLAPGYKIKLSNEEDKKLNGEFRIAFDGSVKLPYQVKLSAAGLSLGQFKRKVVSAFSEFYRVDPGIDIKIIEKRYWVAVGGLVDKPGKFLVSRKTTLDELIGKAGGLQKDSQNQITAKYVRLQQLDHLNFLNLSQYYSGAAPLVVEWQGGETVFFQSDKGRPDLTEIGDDRYVHLLGEVQSAGEYLYRPELDFYDYLLKSGGPTDRADLTNIILVRNTGEKRVTMSFQADDAKTIPALKAGDVLIVRADNLTSTEKKTRLIGEVGGIFGTIASVALLALAI